MKCYEEGHITMATVVDHIKPHRGDKKLFWDRGNWQPLCEHHHNVKTMTEDRDMWSTSSESKGRGYLNL